jgi:hypothetical protein
MGELTADEKLAASLIPVAAARQIVPTVGKQMHAARD